MPVKKRWMKYSDLPFSRAARGTCRWCGSNCPGRRTKWCSDECVYEYKIRSRPGIARAALRRRDKGICAICGINTYALRRHILDLHRNNPKSARKEIKKLERQGFVGCFRGSKVKKSLWEADHIIAVKDGGGQCGLENYQTLCVPCHRQKTNA